MEARGARGKTLARAMFARASFRVAGDRYGRVLAISVPTSIEWAAACLPALCKPRAKRAPPLYIPGRPLYFTTGPSPGKDVDQDANVMATGIRGKRLPAFCMTDCSIRRLLVSANSDWLLQICLHNRTAPSVAQSSGAQPAK